MTAVLVADAISTVLAIADALLWWLVAAAAAATGLVFGVLALLVQAWHTVRRGAAGGTEADGGPCDTCGAQPAPEPADSHTADPAYQEAA